MPAGAGAQASRGKSHRGPTKSTAAGVILLVVLRSVRRIRRCRGFDRRRHPRRHRCLGLLVDNARSVDCDFGHAIRTPIRVVITSPGTQVWHMTCSAVTRQWWWRVSAVSAVGRRHGNAAGPADFPGDVPQPMHGSGLWTPSSCVGDAQCATDHHGRPTVYSR